MANLRSSKTGLPFIVFISQKNDARHAARVKVSPGPKVTTDDMGSYAISPFSYRAGKRLDPQDEKLLARWIDLNISVLQNYWDGTIEYTEDALEQIKSI
jgi:hypothetical protein